MFLNVVKLTKEISNIDFSNPYNVITANAGGEYFLNTVSKADLAKL